MKTINGYQFEITKNDSGKLFLNITTPKDNFVKYRVTTKRRLLADIIRFYPKYLIKAVFTRVV